MKRYYQGDLPIMYIYALELLRTSFKFGTENMFHLCLLPDYLLGQFYVIH
jgi:hypothetical protein